MNTPAVVEVRTLRYPQGDTTVEIAVGHPAWYVWLAESTLFYIVVPDGRITVRKEQAGNRQGNWYWRAYRKQGGKLRRIYLGGDAELTRERLEAVVGELTTDHHAQGAPATTEAQSEGSESRVPKAGFRNPASESRVPKTTNPKSTNPRTKVQNKIIQNPKSKIQNPLILLTKITPPVLRPGLVARPDLVERLRAGLAGPLTLVVAPPGSGKTTLLAQSFGASAGDAVAWLTLDRGDNAPLRFLLAMATALEDARAGAASGALALLRAPEPPSAAVILAQVVAGIATLREPLVLVLDDYHVLADAAVHQLVDRLLERLPATLRLVIASRTEPPLALARLRVRGELTEMRADDLRFSGPTTAALLQQASGRELAGAEVAALEERTEGWAAGLQLAALALRTQRDPAGFIAAFAGTHRFVMDYLVDEVLAHLPPDLHRFLLDTAILERLSAPLCDAVLDAAPPDDAGARGSQSQAMLEEIERRGLFLAPLDDERRWYRYHPLFADVLRAELRRLRGPAYSAELHRRAARWYVAQMPQEGTPALDAAITHALAGNDTALAVDLVAQASMSAMLRGETAILKRWIAALPPDLVRARPFLWFAADDAVLHAGTPAEIEQRLNDAERALIAAASDYPNASTDIALGRAEILTTRSVIALVRGEIERAADLLIDALGVLPEGQPALQSRITLTLGQMYALDGWVDASRMVIRAGFAPAGDDPVAVFLLRSHLAWLDIGTGHLRRASEEFVRARETAQAHGWDASPLIADVQIGLGMVLTEQGRFGEALELLDAGLQPAVEHEQRFQVLVGEMVRARLWHMLGQYDAARTAVATAEHALATFDVPWLRAQVRGLRVEVGLDAPDALGPFAAAIRYDDTPLRLAYARAVLPTGGAETVIALLTPLLPIAEHRGWEIAHLTARLLLARAYDALGDTTVAATHLRIALERAEREHHLLPFLREGTALLPLLRAQPATAFGARVIAAIDDLRHGYTALLPTPETTPVVALTPREREVLDLLAAGASNDTIGATLIVAPSTVKAHLNHLYQKLGVSSRTQAIARARALDLLP